MGPTSHASRSVPALTHPCRAQVTGSAPGGLRNQVVGRKLCSRRSRSPRSQARALRLADPAEDRAAARVSCQTSRACLPVMS